MMTIEPFLEAALSRLGAAALALCLSAVLGGCASSPNRAPVEDRIARPGSAVSTAPAAEAAKPLPGAENAGKPGYYTVKPGDTMIRIGLETGQNWRDVARWNNIDNPSQLEVGQVLRVVAPGTDAAATTARAVPPTKVEARPLDTAASSKPAAVAAGTSAAASAVVAAAPTAAPTAVPAAAPNASAAAQRDSDDDVTWGWPTAGSVTTPYDEVRTKGLVFAGKAGDPVLAAADGRVVYAGSGLRGYGNLVIVKHNNTYITAYAHNQTLLVKEDQVVRRGQKIAEMGSSDAERVQLHFELRKLGKPIDPARLLPPR
jgi:lipoprotein NlpD